MRRLLPPAPRISPLVPPIVGRNELKSGARVDLHRIDGLAEAFYAIVQARRFPNPLLEIRPPVAVA